MKLAPGGLGRHLVVVLAYNAMWQRQLEAAAADGAGVQCRGHAAQRGDQQSGISTVH